MDGVKISAPINRRLMNTPAAQARNGGRWILPQSLVMMKVSLLFIV